MSSHPSFSVLALATLVTLATLAGLCAGPATAQADSEGHLVLFGGQVDADRIHFPTDWRFGFGPPTGRPDRKAEHAAPRLITCLQADGRAGLEASGTR